ncbi:MAG TPA: alpha/beta fold hydrolase [Planctomycetota bacterium]|nr:alpha/beta fold hydrolase [Planctomycetota bacterium]
MPPAQALAALALLAAPLVLPASAAAAGLPPAASGLPDGEEDKGERVEIVTGDKLVLVGSYYPGRSTKQVSPGALLVHDAGGQRADLDVLAARLQRQGFAVLVLDLRGHGNSAKAGLDWESMAPAERERLWAFAMRDLKAGSEWLRTQPAVHAASVSLVGVRAGCTLAVRQAVRDETVRSLVLLDPQAEQLGFNLAKDLEALGGLPTYIGVSKEEHSKAQRLAEFSQRGNGGIDFIQIATFKAPGTTLLSDSRVPADIARWMMQKAVPGKGDR